MSVETIKTDSRHLRGALADELGAATDSFEHDSTVLLKFHGIYQQDDRDVRRARNAARLPLDHSCMVRAAVPGGRITAEQWLALDRLGDLADGSLRLTTRQGVQFHVVPKGSLRELVHDINATLLTTLAACGDVVRNVMGCGWPDERQDVVQPLLDELVARFRPRTRAYWELWVDGDKAATAEPPADEVEPVYGDAYLPRKFKIAVGWPGDNCVDVLANDVGIVPTLADGTSGELTGYVVFVGGGLGMSHAREDDTYPRLATPLAWVPVRGPEPQVAVVDVVEAVVTTQRDFGNREDRHRARLKYLVDERGIDWVRGEVEGRLGTALAPPVELPEWTADAHHGTHPVHAHGGETAAIGLPVPAGRVVDTDEVALRTALRELTADGTVTELRVTPRQDVVLLGIPTDRVAEVEDRLRAHGVPLADDVSALRRLAIACPALPTCGQALGEAERVLPDLVSQLEKVVADTGNGDLPVRINMTGCPNGCARPYTAEIGIVGRTKTTYDVYVGGSAGGDRLGQRIRADVPLDQLATVLAPVFERYASSGHDRTFGDWSDGVGPETIAQWLPTPVVRRRARAVTAVTVHLVGAGPGDPELLTVRAARLLAAADVVVHDALVGDGVLDLVAPGAELIDVGKRPGRPVPQELINTLLVHLGRQHDVVVRLKGGDPFVFGRGGEEAIALAEAGVAFDVVPGITSAVAAPAAAGVPVTHRGVAAAFTVVTGHRRAGEPDVDWRSLARVGGTIVVLMGVAQRAVIAGELIAGGLDASTPVAAVRSASTPDEEVHRCRLDELAGAPVDSPAVIVIGAVAAFELAGTVAAARRTVAAT